MTDDSATLLRRYMTLCESETHDRVPRLWLGPRGEVIDLGDADESHSSMVFNNPDQFGLTAEIVADALNDDSGELEFDWLIACAEANGWVRISRDISSNDPRGIVAAISARDARGISRGFRWLLHLGFHPQRLEVEIESPVPGSHQVRSRYYKLDGERLELFKRRGVLTEAALRENASDVRTPDDIDPNAKVVLPIVYRGVEAGTDAQRAIRVSKGGDLGDGVYVTPRQWLAKTYGGGPQGARTVHSYRIEALFPEDVAYLFGGKRHHEPVSLISGNGIELWHGAWTSANLEAALRDAGIRLVIGTPDSIGLNQIAVRDPSVLHPVTDQ